MLHDNAKLAVFSSDLNSYLHRIRKKRDQISVLHSCNTFKHIVVIFGKQHPENAAKLLIDYNECPSHLINVTTLPCKMKCYIITA